MENPISKLIQKEMIGIIYSLKELGVEITKDKVKDVLQKSFKAKADFLINEENFDKIIKFVEFEFLYSTTFNTPDKKQASTIEADIYFEFLNNDILFIYEKLLLWDGEKNLFKISIPLQKKRDKDSAKKEALDKKIKFKKLILSKTEEIKKIYHSDFNFIDDIDFDFAVSLIK